MEVNFRLMPAYLFWKAVKVVYFLKLINNTRPSISKVYGASLV